MTALLAKEMLFTSSCPSREREHCSQDAVIDEQLDCPYIEDILTLSVLDKRGYCTSTRQRTDCQIGTKTWARERLQTLTNAEVMPIKMIEGIQQIMLAPVAVVAVAEAVASVLSGDCQTFLARSTDSPSASEC